MSVIERVIRLTYTCGHSRHFAEDSLYRPTWCTDPDHDPGDWPPGKYFRSEVRQFGQVPPGHPDARKPVLPGEHPRDCDCGDCP